MWSHILVQDVLYLYSVLDIAKNKDWRFAFESPQTRKIWCSCFFNGKLNNSYGLIEVSIKISIELAFYLSRLIQITFSHIAISAIPSPATIEYFTPFNDKMVDLTPFTNKMVDFDAIYQ